MSLFNIPSDLRTYYVDDVEESMGIACGASYLVHNGRVISRSEALHPGGRYLVVPRVLGGKGGFGSMLRAIGAQIEKTTSREACRDLSGRRIRDVNNEKKLKEWVSKQADREREKEEREERRRVKRQKFLEDNPGKMDDPEFNAQYNAIMEKNEAAVQQGLAKMKEGGSTSRKRKADSNGTLDKYDRWNMLGGMAMDELDSDSGSEAGEAQPGCSSTSPEAAGPSSSSSSPSSSSPPRDSTRPPPSATVTSSSQDAGISGASVASSNSGPSPFKVPKLFSSNESGDFSSAAASSTKVSASASAGQSAGAASLSVQSSQTSGSGDAESKGAASSTVGESEPVDLDSTPSVETLQEIGMERLKAELMRRGLKCGGSLTERAQRLFSVKGLHPDDYPAKLLAKGKGPGKSSNK